MVCERLSLEANVDAPSRARAGLTRALGDDPRAPAVALASSELVTNAVQHGHLGPSDTIALDVDGGHHERLHVSVRHHGRGFEIPPAQLHADGGGWGLEIVAAMSSDWGVEQGGGQTVVWFELD